jgi:flagellin
MGMVIKNNLDSVRTYNIYNRNSIALSDAMYKVSSGQRINSAKDGAADLAISERMRSRIKATDQANRNAQNANNMMKTAEGALSNISSILARMHEIAVEAANGNNTTSDYALFQNEITSLANQIDKNAEVKYNGIALLDGTTGAALKFKLEDESGDLEDAFTIGSAKSADLQVNGITIGNQDDANNAIVQIEAAQTTLAGRLADLGSYETRLGYISDNLATLSENLQASESVIRDQDMAKGMTEFAKYNILTQASQFMLAQASQNPYSVLNLLQQ